MNNFRTFHLAVEFNRQARRLPIRGALKTQLERAASSIALNLAEGRGKPTVKDQKRYFSIALGSLRECQAALILAELECSESWLLLDKLGAHLFRLIKNA